MGHFYSKQKRLSFNNDFQHRQLQIKLSRQVQGFYALLLVRDSFILRVCSRNFHKGKRTTDLTVILYKASHYKTYYFFWI